MMRKLTKREKYLVEEITKCMVQVAKQKAYYMRADQYSIEHEAWFEGYGEALRWILDIIQEK